MFRSPSSNPIFAPPRLLPPTQARVLAAPGVQVRADREMFARFFGGSTPEDPDGAGPKEKEDVGDNGPVETVQKDQAVTTRISKMDSIIR